MDNKLLALNYFSEKMTSTQSTEDICGIDNEAFLHEDNDEAFLHENNNDDDKLLLSAADNAELDSVQNQPIPYRIPYSPTPDLPSIQIQIIKLQEQMELLEKIISEPQILTISGVHNLKTEIAQNWKDKVYNIFYEARIPLFWILDILPDEDNITNPDLIYVYFINFQVKEKVKENLENYLSTVYNNKIFTL
jgi:hypothetical protein